MTEALPRGHVYWHELVGVAVRDEAGLDLGRVVDVYRAGGAEVLTVAGPLGELEIPIVAGIVRVFDPAGEGVVVDRAGLGLDETEERPGRRGPIVGRGQRPPRRRASVGATSPAASGVSRTVRPSRARAGVEP
ncbi:MAG: hypothetical protein KatS3mg065_0506 [Chloroflexota bacterium]|nr:MAG: hypothetical protein KatS3mg065_0506 [Chloroflexota bacterium]